MLGAPFTVSLPGEGEIHGDKYDAKLLLADHGLLALLKDTPQLGMLPDPEMHSSPTDPYTPTTIYHASPTVPHTPSMTTPRRPKKRRSLQSIFAPAFFAPAPAPAHRPRAARTAPCSPSVGAFPPYFPPTTSWSFPPAGLRPYEYGYEYAHTAEANAYETPPDLLSDDPFANLAAPVDTSVPAVATGTAAADVSRTPRSPLSRSATGSDTEDGDDPPTGVVSSSVSSSASSFVSSLVSAISSPSLVSLVSHTSSASHFSHSHSHASNSSISSISSVSSNSSTHTISAHNTAAPHRARSAPAPAHTRPAFTPRPSLPSLSALAHPVSAQLVHPKVKKGHVGAQLPPEPWDADNDVHTDSPDMDAEASGLREAVGDYLAGAGRAHLAAAVGDYFACEEEEEEAMAVSSAHHSSTLSTLPEHIPTATFADSSSSTTSVSSSAAHEPNNTSVILPGHERLSLVIGYNHASVLATLEQLDEGQHGLELSRDSTLSDAVQDDTSVLVGQQLGQFGDHAKPLPVANFDTPVHDDFDLRAADPYGTRAVSRYGAVESGDPLESITCEIEPGTSADTIRAPLSPGAWTSSSSSSDGRGTSGDYRSSESDDGHGTSEGSVGSSEGSVAGGSVDKTWVPDKRDSGEEVFYMASEWLGDGRVSPRWVDRSPSPERDERMESQVQVESDNETEMETEMETDRVMRGRSGHRNTQEFEFDLDIELDPDFAYDASADEPADASGGGRRAEGSGAYHAGSYGHSNGYISRSNGGAGYSGGGGHGVGGSSSNGHGGAGGGRRGDGGDDRRDKRPSGLPNTAPPESDSDEDEDEDSTDDYGDDDTPSSHAWRQAPSSQSHSSSAAQPAAPLRSDSPDDNVPLARQIPTALTAQRTIRRQVRNEMDQRRQARARRPTEGSTTSAEVPTFPRALSSAVPASSSQEAAMHARLPEQTASSSRVQEPAATAAPRVGMRPRTKTLPGNTQNPFTLNTGGLVRKPSSAQNSHHMHLPTSPMPLSSGPSSPMPPSPMPQSPMPPPSMPLSPMPPPQPHHDLSRARTDTRRPSRSPPRESDHKRMLRGMPSLNFHRPRTADADAQLGRSMTSVKKPSKGDGAAQTLRGRPSEEGRGSMDRTRSAVTRMPSLRRPSVDRERERVARPAPEQDHGAARPRGTSRPAAPSKHTPPVDTQPAKTMTMWQQRVFIGNMQRFCLVEIGTGTLARDVLRMVESQGQLERGASASGWMLFEVSQDFGMERPIRSFEHLSDVCDSWNPDKTVNMLVIKKTLMAPILSSSAMPSSSPLCSGYVQWEHKRGKWQKRWLVLREHSLWLSKRDTGKDETFLCSLNNFDAYCVTRVNKAPKPYVFAVKSTDNISFFESTADYVHVFSCGEREGENWLQKVLLARSYVLYQERNVLTGNAAPTMTRKQRPAQPLLTVSAPYTPDPETPAPVTFEPGSLLAKRTI